MTIDEILEELSKIGREGEGADRFRALKALSGMSGAQIALPEPLSDDEIVDRLFRLLAGAGKTNADRAMKKAFPA